MRNAQLHAVRGKFHFLDAEDMQRLGAWVHPAWFALCAFMGASLIFSGRADYCGHTTILAMALRNHGKADEPAKSP